MTSSPFFMPIALTANSRAAVPLQTAKACLRLHNSAIPDSSFSINGPSEEIHPVSIHS